MSISSSYKDGKVQSRARLFAMMTAFAAALTPAVAAAADFDVRTHRAWRGYAIPNGLWLSADYTGDGKSDLLHVVRNTDYVHTWTSRGNGRYNIGTFRPWRGYAMPNGLWLNADLNGDGKTDVVHVVRATDYVHTWLSRGDGTFKVGTFRPWRGYAMPNGVWLVADLNGDKRDDLVHVVNGTDYVHTWISNGNGTFRVGTFRPWRGYAMPNGVWLVADLDGNGRDDLVHAVRNTDYVHPWISNGDGTFKVKTFRPWRGYAIPNGLWRVGDFDGDGRDDILHVVRNTDYVHTWTSRGDGTFKIGTFRPWRGYAMPNGLWLVDDYDGDGKDDVVHAVARTSYVHVWRSKGANSFDIGTFSPWPGYAIPNGIWLNGDVDGNRKGDIVHVVNGTNYVHPWLSTMPGPNEFKVAGLEVSQAVQNMAHGVPLIATKTTVARVYLDYRGTSPVTVRGQAIVRNLTSGQSRTVSSLNSVQVNPAENNNLRVKREDLAKSLNFQVPSVLLPAGQLQVQLIRITNASTGQVLRCADCTAERRRVALQNSAPLRLRVVGLRYQMNSVTNAPRAIDFALVRSWLRRAYPVAQVQMSQITVNANATPPFFCGNANAQITAMRNLDISNGADARTHYYGLVHDGGFFMRGCANGIPGNPSPGTPASGPTGNGTWGWDNDGSYGDWYTGHELGHTLGRFHIGSGCGETSDDPNYPYPNGQISGNNGAFVGLDVGDPAQSIPMAALPGTVWRDVMSYCRNQWLSNYTYVRIRDRLNAENALPAGPALLVAGATPAGVAGAEEAMAPSLDAPPAIAAGVGLPPVVEVGGKQIAIMVAPASAPPGEVAPEMESPAAIVEPAYTMMPEVVVISGRGPVPPSATPDGATPESMAAEEEPAPALPQPLGVSMVQGDFVNVTGLVNLSTKTGEISFVNRVSQGLARQGVADDTVQVRVLDPSGELVAIYPVFVLLESERDPGEDLRGLIDALVPRPDNVGAVELLIDRKVVDRFESSAAVPTAMTAGAAALSAQLSADGKELSVALPGAGPAPGNTSYIVQISTDNGASWQTVALGLHEPATSIDLASLGELTSLQVRILVSTGFDNQVLTTQVVDLLQ